MKKKVIMVMLAASMVGSSVPAGVMASDFADSAVVMDEEEATVEETDENGEVGKDGADGIEEQEEGAVDVASEENPAPTPTVVPGRPATPTPTPTVVPGRPVTPTPTPEPTVTEEAKAGTGEVGVPKYDSSTKTVTFNIKGTEDFTYYVAAFPIGTSEEEVKNQFILNEATNEAKANQKISVTFENYDKSTDLWVYFQWPDGSVTCAKEMLFLPTISGIKWTDHNTVQLKLGANHPFHYYYVVTNKAISSADAKAAYDESKAVNEVSANEAGQVTVSEVPEGSDFQVWVYFRMNDGTMKYSRIPISTTNRPAVSTVPTVPAKTYSVSQCKVEGLEKPLKFYPGTFYKFTATGAGEDNKNPVKGDEKYVPLGWSMSRTPSDAQINRSWKIGTGKGITKAGTYSIYVFFQKYRYDGAQWIEKGDPEYKTVQFSSAKITVKKPSLNAKSVTLKKGQSVTLKMTNQSSGFKVTSWKSSNTSVVSVSKSGKLTAGKKTGKATITVTTSHGTSAKVSVTVQSGTVKTTGISGLKSSVTVKKGKTFTLKPVLAPISSQEKVTYSSSAKSVVSVSSKGVIKGLRKGKATITVRSGKVKKNVTVVVK